MFVATLVLTTMGLNRKLSTIKALRIPTGCGLKYAKDLFELAASAQPGMALLVSDDTCKPSGVSPLTDTDGMLLGQVSWIDCDSTATRTEPVPEPTPTVVTPKPRFVRHLMVLPGHEPLGPALIRPNDIISVRPNNVADGGSIVYFEDGITFSARAVYTDATTDDIIALLED